MTDAGAALPEAQDSLSFTARVPVVDANVGVGHRHDRPAPFEDPDGLLAEMSRHGVAGAVIYHVQCEAISPVDGNEALEAWLSDERLTAQWTLGADSASLNQLQALRADGRISSVRLHDTQEARVPLVKWIYGEALRWLSDEGIPLWLSVANNDVEHAMALLKGFPQLDVVLLGAHYTHASVVRGVLNELPRASLELSRYEVLGEVEALVGEFGAGRLIYGSYYPRYAMGPMLYYVHRIGLSDAELALVCGGNVRRLLRED